MPKGPQGQKRPADVIGCSIRVAKIATGEIVENITKIEHARKGGLKGGKARSKKLTPDERADIARIAAAARWKKTDC